MHHPTDRITHNTAFVTNSHGSPVGTRNSSMGPHHEGRNRVRRATVGPRRNRKKREKEREVQRGGKECRQLEARGATPSS